MLERYEPHHFYQYGLFPQVVFCDDEPSYFFTSPMIRPKSILSLFSFITRIFSLCYFLDH